MNGVLLHLVTILLMSVLDHIGPKHSLYVFVMKHVKRHREVIDRIYCRAVLLVIWWYSNELNHMARLVKSCSLSPQQ